MKYVFGNWKANLSQAEVNEWMSEFASLYHPSDAVTVGIFPSFLYLRSVASMLGSLPQLVIGAQAASPHHVNKGQTGAVIIPTLVGIVRYVLIAHSEFRAITTYTNDDYVAATREAMKNEITPVFCVRGTQDLFPENVPFVAYEPTDAIGTGNNKTIEEVCYMKGSLHLPASTKFIYGGSVNKDNCQVYARENDIDGVLVGTASLSPQEFNSIVTAFQSP